MKEEKNLFMYDREHKIRVDGSKTVNEESMCSKYTVHMYECHVEIHCFVQIIYNKEINFLTSLVNKIERKNEGRHPYANGHTHISAFTCYT